MHVCKVSVTNTGLGPQKIVKTKEGEPDFVKSRRVWSLALVRRFGLTCGPAMNGSVRIDLCSSACC